MSSLPSLRRARLPIFFVQIRIIRQKEAWQIKLLFHCLLLPSFCKSPRVSSNKAACLAIYPSVCQSAQMFRFRLGLRTEFRTEKIPRNRLGTISVIPRKKVLIPRHSEFRGRANSEARNGTERNRIPQKHEVLGNWHGLYDYSDIEPATSPV
jgi:hypothetical protein